MNIVKGCMGIALLVLAHAAGEKPEFPLHEALKAKEYDRALEALQLATKVDLPDGSW